MQYIRPLCEKRELFRARRRKIYEGLFGPNTLAAAGLAVMPALLFNPSTALRAVQFLFFWFLAALAGKKTRPFPTILIIIGIAAFNLIIPYGRVLFSIGAFRVTQGALAAGIHRAVTLEALVMLSRVAIRADLRLPGLFGELTGESFRVFSLLVGQKHRVARKTFVADIDRLMFELGGDVPEATEPESVSSPGAGETLPVKTKPAGYVILAVTVILAWLPMVKILELGSN